MSTNVNEVKTPESIRSEFQLANRLTQREGRRLQWSKDFTANYVALADTISESIASSVVIKLGEYLENPYKSLPTSSHPLENAFCIDLGRPKKVSLIQSLAKEKADLEPFKEWFSVFGESKIDQPEINNKTKSDVVFDENPVNSCYVPQKMTGKDLNYFEAQMSKIGQRLESKVGQQLALLGSRVENKDFRFKVEWYRKAERFLSNPSNFTDNVLNVSTWIETNGAKK